MLKEMLYKHPEHAVVINRFEHYSKNCWWNDIAQCWYYSTEPVKLYYTVDQDPGDEN